MSKSSVPLVVTAAFPFVPADLSMAHMASTYVPADIYTRFQKMLGRDCVLISGIDVHSIQVSTDGRTRAGAEPLCSDYADRYRKDFEAMNIACDSFARTDHPAHLELVNAVLLRLHRAGCFDIRPRTVNVCPSCGAAPPPRLAPKLGSQLGCPYCGDVLGEETRDHVYLRLAPHYERLAELCTIVAPQDQRKWLSAQLEEPPQDWCISRDHSIGIALPFGRPGLSLYLWMESLIGYETQARLALGNIPDDIRFVHFIGKNIQYYHAVAWPVLLRYGLERADDCFRCSGRGFLNIERSTAWLVDIDAATASFHPDWLRLFLALKVRDGQADYSLNEDELLQTVRTVGHNTLGNVLCRMVSVLARHPDEKKVLDHASPLVERFMKEIIPGLERDLESCRVRAAVQRVVAYARTINAQISQEQLYLGDDPYKLGQLAFATASLVQLLRPIMPKLSQVYDVFDGWDHDHLSDALKAHQYPIRYTGSVWPGVT